MSRLREVPVWWSTLTKTRAGDAVLLDLLHACERAGVAKNDRVGVERIWQARQIARAQLREASGEEAA